MYTSLTSKYRPRKFRQLVGQPDASIVKAVMRDADLLPPLLLFCGPSGVGKTTVARIIAALVNCDDAVDGEPCGSCDKCSAVQAGTLPNVYEVDAASYGTADQLRDLVAKCNLSSIGTRVVILDEAQSISAQGWNVLLKVLEEPPPACMFILLTSEPKKVPAKIRTRALQFTFRPVSPDVLRAYLTKVVAHSKVPNVSEEDIEVILDHAEGSVREALMMVEQCSSSDKPATSLYATKDHSIDVLHKMLDKDYAAMMTSLDVWWDEVGDAKSLLSQIATCLEKVTLCKHGVNFYAGASRTRYKYLADSLSVDDLVNSLATLSDWYPQVHSKSQLIMLLAKLYKGINGSSVTETRAATVDTPSAPKEDFKDRLGAL